MRASKDNGLIWAESRQRWHILQGASPGGFENLGVDELDDRAPDHVLAIGGGAAARLQVVLADGLVDFDRSRAAERRFARLMGPTRPIRRCSTWRCLR